MERAIRWRLTVAMLLANVAGTAVVFVLMVWVLPPPELRPDSRVDVINLIGAVVYIAIATPIAIAWILRLLEPGRRWLFEDREPTLEEQRSILRAPLLIIRVMAALWLVAALLFGALNALYALEVGQRVAVTVAFGGLTTSAIAYLLCERLLRPVAARALAARPPEEATVGGVAGRVILGWALGTGVPVLGLVLVGASALVEQDFSSSQLAVAIVALGGAALVAGFVTSVLVAHAAADPVLSVRRALAQVEEGDLDVEVPVYDGTEIGLLQSGFNRMVEGIRERERIRDLFGRQVGEDVARAALDGQIEMGGEVRDVAVLFVDLVGSTTLAATRPAGEVVDLLNSFFAVVVDVVGEHRGWINKFEGDAALAVFGTPVALDDAADGALAAARTLTNRLREELPDLDVGVGVAAGPAVAGNIGEPRRYEYTVIGDPVNEAARLTELAKSAPERVLASAEILDRAGLEEAARWRTGEEVTLRGRTRPTRLAVPR